MEILKYMVVILFVMQFNEGWDFEINYSTNDRLGDKAPWVVIIKKHEDNFYDEYSIIGYGSLINPSLVMTIASILHGKVPPNLQVNADCYTTTIDKNNCHETRNVTELTYVEDVINKNYHILDHDYGFLLLEKPFELNHRIGVINLAQDNEQYLQNNCFIFAFGWGMDISSFNDAFFIVPFKASIDNKYIYIQNDQNCLLGDEDEKLCITGNWNKKFLGSPVICKLKRDSSKYVQVSVVKAEIIYSEGLKSQNQSGVFSMTNNYLMDIASIKDEISYLSKINLIRDDGINDEANSYLISY